MMQTEYEFKLPKGYIDDQGNLHQEGVMRLATAADEILPLKDPRIQRNQAYFVILLLSRVVTKFGSLPHINPKVIEGLFAEDLNYLESLYNDINGHTQKLATACPECHHEFEWEPNGMGGS